MTIANESIKHSITLPAPAARMSSTIQRAFPHLTAEQVEEFGHELDAIRTRTVADLGERE